jgi:putative membrane-bound dehydrogenase-like protein
MAILSLLGMKLACSSAPKDVEFPPPLSPQEALAAFRTKPELQIDLVVSEPLIVDPVAIDWGADGRLWVVEMHDYPTGLDGSFKPGGRVKVLEQRNGRYDTATLFLDRLPFPTGVMAWGRGALICAAPDILYAEDTNDDGKADVVRTNFTGFATHNYQARVNGLTWGLDGWVYGASGLFGGKIKSLATSRDVDLSGRDFRMRPDTGESEPVAGLSQHGRVRDDFDNWFGCDNSTFLWHFPLPEHYVRRNPHVPSPDPRVYPVKGPDANRVFPVSRTLERFNDPSHANRATSACGVEIYRDELLGTNYYGNAFVCESVHNLVHRLVLEPDGATFTARRAPDEQTSEFLASTDNWFRPVQARTGPDGALWVVDMYRFVIEHPRWIPTNRLAKLDVRAGADKGRIYRLYPRDQKPRPVQNITRLNTEELIKALDSPNGPTRDLIHRQLIERKDVSINTLTALATNGTYAAARAQALWILKQKNGVLPTTADSDQRVRRQQFRLYPDWPASELRLALRSQDRGTAFDIALAMGDRKDKTGAQILSSVAQRGSEDRWVRAAVVSSAVPHIGGLVDMVCRRSDVNSELVEKLVTIAVRAKHEEATERIIDFALPNDGESPSEQQFRLWRIIFDSKEAGELLRNARIRRVLEFARQAARNGSAAAIGLLAREKEQLDPDVTLLVSLAGKHAAALQRLSQIREPIVAEHILKAWPGFSPGLRQKFIEILVTRKEWTSDLRAAVDGGVIALAEIPLQTRQRLNLGPNRNLRDEVLAKYKGVAELSAQLDRGAGVFEKNCATCHTLGTAGKNVGPNLAEFAGKSIEDFLVAILDPNAAIEPKFVAYEVECKDGRSLSGVVKGETATSLTVVQGGGSEEKILRSEISRITASTLSLMPEGLEQAITPQDMADLIAWIKKEVTGKR